MSSSTILRSGGSSRHKWIPPTPDELSPRFPQLEIVELLGQGGMGAVYKVRQKDLNRWAALKILSDEIASDPNFAERFQREARAMAQLGHQHIVIVYEFGQRDGLYFLLMEYVDGVTLRQASSAGQLSTTQALGIVTQICEALQFAHEEGVVHRDIKPENILIDKRGRVKIADFGLAKLLGHTPDAISLTGTHQVMGTPAYMAPEQMEGTKGVDHRADLFSLGVVFYELLTGELPLGRFAPPSQKYSLDIRLDEVVLRSLEKEPDRRYQHARQIKSDVETIRSQPASVKVDSPKPLARATPTKRHGWLLPVAIVLISLPLACLVLPLILLGFRVSSSDHRPAAIVGSAFDYSRQGQTEKYLAQRDREVLEQARQRQLHENTQDENEQFAVLQFTSEGVKLHRDAFEEGTLSNAQRQDLEKILTDIHRRYLALEKANIVRSVGVDEQITEIQAFSSELVNLENELWIDIDSRFPVGLQKLLRERLPLYADESSPPRRLAELKGAYHTDGTVRAIPFGTTPPPGLRSGTYGPILPYDYRQTFKYQHLLGSKRGLPMWISIGRQGKWFSWEIGQIQPMHDPSNPNQKVKPAQAARETGRGPQLPSGLRRFWIDPASEDFEKYQHLNEPATFEPPSEGSADGAEALVQRFKDAHRDGDWKTIAECYSDAAIDEMLILTIVSLTPQRRDILRLFKAKNPEFDYFSERTQAQITLIRQRVKEIAQTREGFRELTSPIVHEMLGTDNTELFARLQEFELGAESSEILKRFTIKMRSATTAEVFHADDNERIWLALVDGAWKIDSILSMSMIEKIILEEPSFPEPIPKAETLTLEGPLLALDKLRAGANTPWEQVEKQVNELLAKYPAPASQGRIHWQAAHVYGQSDISGHAADVTRHAQLALKYERDPVQRGWLYMYLGSAAEVRDTKPETFVERRANATKWYLKGYDELLPYRLPEIAPELPAVNKLGTELGPQDEFDPDRVAAEVRHATEIKVREETAVTRELVQRRDIYIGRLQDLFGRMHEMYDKEADAKERLSEIAKGVFQSAREPEAIRNDLLRRVSPAANPPIPEKFNEKN